MLAGAAIHGKRQRLSRRRPRQNGNGSDGRVARCSSYRGDVGSCELPLHPCKPTFEVPVLADPLDDLMVDARVPCVVLRVRIWEVSRVDDQRGRRHAGAAQGLSELLPGEAYGGAAAGVLGAPLRQLAVQVLEAEGHDLNTARGGRAKAFNGVVRRGGLRRSRAQLCPAQLLLWWHPEELRSTVALGWLTRSGHRDQRSPRMNAGLLVRWQRQWLALRLHGGEAVGEALRQDPALDVAAVRVDELDLGEGVTDLHNQHLLATAQLRFWKLHNLYVRHGSYVGFCKYCCAEPYVLPIGRNAAAGLGPAAPFAAPAAGAPASAGRQPGEVGPRSSCLCLAPPGLFRLVLPHSLHGVSWHPASLIWRATAACKEPALVASGLRSAIQHLQGLFRGHCQVTFANWGHGVAAPCRRDEIRLRLAAAPRRVCGRRQHVAARQPAARPALGRSLGPSVVAEAGKDPAFLARTAGSLVEDLDPITTAHREVTHVWLGLEAAPYDRDRWPSARSAGCAGILGERRHRPLPHPGRPRPALGL
mmetsp:Transcript_58260/g.161056  ORF Transcript_58260/g.161056 Transcript_58260/m.161056 type:complete len:532 (-) Transcript_58260:16-1611(-)